MKAEVGYTYKEEDKINIYVDSELALIIADMLRQELDRSMDMRDEEADAVELIINMSKAISELYSAVKGVEECRR